jgi:hypothetical protein
MTPGDLNRIESAFAEAAVGFGVRSRALGTTETFRNPGVTDLFGRFARCKRRRLARGSTSLDRGPRRQHVNSQD